MVSLNHTLVVEVIFDINNLRLSLGVTVHVNIG
jgi:hypothetical protein